MVDAVCKLQFYSKSTSGKNATIRVNVRFEDEEYNTIQDYGGNADRNTNSQSLILNEIQWYAPSYAEKIVVSFYLSKTGILIEDIKLQLGETSLGNMSEDAVFPGSDVAVIPESAANGLYSFTVVDKNVGSTSIIQEVLTSQVIEEPGHMFNLSFWIAQNDNTGESSVRANLQFLDENRQFLGEANSNNFEHYSHNFAQYSFAGQLALNTRFVVITIHSTKRGTFVDDIALAVDGQSIAIVNPGAETGNLTGWHGTSGIYATNEMAHSGSYSFGTNSMLAGYWTYIQQTVDILIPPTPEPEPVEPASWKLYNIIREICNRTGIPPSKQNAFALKQLVDGFSVTNEHSAHTAIESLARIFLFDPASFNGVLNFVNRGQDTLAVIDSDEFVDDGKEEQEVHAKDAISVPRVMWLQYFDIEGGTNPDNQFSDRSYDTRNKSDLKTQTTVIMNADAAKRTVVINHKIAIEEQNGEIKFSLPDSYLFLTPTDCIEIEGKRYRITEEEIDVGLQHYKATRDRQSSYETQEVGVPIVPPTTAPDTYVGKTVFHLLDISPLLESDDKVGYYIAAAGETDNWKGAAGAVSYDGGANFIDSYDISTESVIGQITQPFSAYTENWVDNTNAIEVELLRPDMELESVDYVGTLNRMNTILVGDELMAYQNADETAPGKYILTGLLRGRNGTKPVAHIAGERFVLIDRSEIIFIESETYRIGKNLTFRFASFNSDEIETQTVFFNGNSQRELAPKRLSAFRKPDNTVEFSWFGRSVIGGAGHYRHGFNFRFYEVSINGQEWTRVDGRKYNFADPGGSLNLKVRQVNVITGAGPESEISI